MVKYFGLIKKRASILLFVALLTIISVTITGCFARGNQYHDGDSVNWIEQQVKNGTLTPEQAEELVKQQKE